MSAYLKQIHKIISSFSQADKVVFFGNIVLLLGLFLPWFTINASEIIANNLATTEIAFTGFTYIIGYLIYFFSLFSFYSLEKKLPFIVATISFACFLLNVIFSKTKDGLSLFDTFLFVLLNAGILFFFHNSKLLRQTKRHFINLFVGIESLILIFVASMIYHKIALGFTSANLSFGIYTSLLGAIAIAYAGYSQWENYKKINTKEIFSQPGRNLHGGINLSPDLNIDKNTQNQNNTPASKEGSQLSFGDYE